MRKADLMDELRSEIGVVSDKCCGKIKNLYEFVCASLYKKVSVYQSVSIYLAENRHFLRKYHHGEEGLPLNIPYGEGLFSLAAARGGVVREKIDSKIKVFVPFHKGHHLIGELVVIGTSGGVIDDEDVSLFCEITSLLETKVASNI